MRIKAVFFSMVHTTVFQGPVLEAGEAGKA
jgi:hypothetical protein